MTGHSDTIMLSQKHQIKKVLDRNAAVRVF
jgi:hypothetical protein